MQGPASASEIHRQYREAIRVENGSRPHKDWLRPMTYSSFITYITRAKQSALIKVVGSKALELTNSPLIGIRGARVIEPQLQTVYALTTDGQEETGGWYNLKGYAEGEEITAPRGKRRTRVPQKQAVVKKPASKISATKSVVTKKSQAKKQPTTKAKAPPAKKAAARRKPARS